MTDHLSSFDLSALALEALQPEAKAKAAQHLATCERCQTRAAEMQEERKRFDAGGVLSRTLPAIEERVARRWWSGPARFLAPAVVAAAIAAFFALPHRPESGFTPKGGPTLQVFAKRGIEVFAVSDGATLKPGDQLRFVVDPGDFGHVLIASLDGAGHASIYYPFDAAESGTVTPQSRNELPGSVSLDATLGEEHLYVLLSKEPVSAKEVRERLEQERSSAHLTAGAQLTLSFRKAVP